MNSALYARSEHRIGTVEAATALIGLYATRQLVAAAAVGGAFRAVPGVDLPDVDLPDFWRFSPDVAKLAEELSLDRGMAFTAGLLHGTGDLIMKMAMPERPSLRTPFPADGARAAELEPGLHLCRRGRRLRGKKRVAEDRIADR